MNLTQLQSGQKAIISKVNDDLLALKLFEMGMLPGETIALENIAPFGDPIAFALNESKICLRLADAACVEIKLIEN